MAVVVLAVTLVVGAWAGVGWFLAARDRDAARADRVAERAANAQLRVAVETQNSAVEAAAAKLVAKARGQAAQQQVAATGGAWMPRWPRSPTRAPPRATRPCRPST